MARIIARLPPGPVQVSLASKLAYEISELDEAAGICRARAFKLIAEGRLKARKDGSKTVVLHRDLEAYLDSLPLARPDRAA